MLNAPGTRSMMSAGFRIRSQLGVRLTARLQEERRRDGPRPVARTGERTDWTGQMPRRSDYSVCEVSTPLIFKLVDSEAVFMSLKLTVIHKNICAHFNGSF